ncbi:hypothetical protein EDI_341910 [Entamoeba dispar SAW760]|uniref:Uncharacterized protein n=1 Tax=Entamoeba dispar (strain ATCC PRA-260 / SAW760) TaxID=370354 RepID=B0E9M3_ENTDS|nr:uncharacterized protein EDI_341910 [Entamoeba dispar SAW760]EDR28741.1 hypothetical protein EDI_341910 [Entamoeba dispar SAW760]|eukprot:EDR28741.1 hypothetical protein EDI_341910 [Entamoeba dispar SAW760]
MAEQTQSNSTVSECEEVLDNFGDIEIETSQPNNVLKKKRVIISREPMNQVIVLEIKNWCNLGYSKVILFETSKHLLYEIKQVHLEYGCWYINPILLSDSSFKISSIMDPFYIVLHFLCLHNVNETTKFSSLDDIYTLLPSNVITELLKDTLTQFVKEENSHYKIDFPLIKEVLIEKKNLIDNYLKGIVKNESRQTKGMDKFLTKKVDNDTLFLYLGEYWYNLMNWKIPEEQIVYYADDYTQYEKKKKVTKKKISKKKK